MLGPYGQATGVRAGVARDSWALSPKGGRAQSSTLAAVLVPDLHRMPLTFSTAVVRRRPTSGWIGDALVVAVLAAIIAVGVDIAHRAGGPPQVRGPSLALSAAALPGYAGLSTARMLAAYVLSLGFSLAYGSAAASSARAGRVLLPVLDVLQSVPILSFLPVVVLALAAMLPVRVAAEVAAIALIFTSQAWNLTFAWYQSLTTVPEELREAASVFRLNAWLRLRLLNLPFACLSLVWNSMMSWAGGWFFLMAAEAFTVGGRDYRLPGLGSFLKEAADRGVGAAIAAGALALVAVIVSLDQLVWRPMLAWAYRFRLETIDGSSPPTSWALGAMRGSRMLGWARRRWLPPVAEWLDARMVSRFPAVDERRHVRHIKVWPFVLPSVVGLLAFGAWRGGHLLTSVQAEQWTRIATGVGVTTLRVAAALVVALVWTIPVGVAIGCNHTLARWLQPLVQIAASLPATALFPVLAIVLLRLPGGMDSGAVVLLLLGTQWYLLFNIIAGAQAIPKDLEYTAVLLGMGRAQRWTTLLLPALAPYLVTGLITSAGGAWNASIVAEYVQFRAQTIQVTGVGALIAASSAAGDYPILLAATLSMVVTVVALNQLLWRRLYRLAENRYRLD